MLDMVDLLATRRSVVAQNLGPPGPSEAQLQTLLTLGARVPDHGKLEPWRFVTFTGGERQAFGDILASTYKNANGEGDAEAVEFERARFLRAPVVIAVISKAAPHPKIPEWEQVLSAGAVCQNLLVAAAALGFAAQWLTEWYAYDEQIAGALGLTPGERVAGFVYLGTAQTPPKPRPRPDMAQVVKSWGAVAAGNTGD
jgi:nitroreductase